MESNKIVRVNWGTLPEIPQVCVNRFGNFENTYSMTINPVKWDTSRAFFLTHVDKEINEDVLTREFLHTIGNPENKCRLYLSQLAFNYLKYWTTTDYIEHGEYVSALLDQLKENGSIVFLETNKTIRVQFFQMDAVNDLYVNVTAMSSGSDFGSIMILFEVLWQPGKRILYTGDCRLRVSDLERFTCLHNPYGVVKKIDKIYLDTTYCALGVEELPSRQAVTKEVLNLITSTNELKPNVHFDIITPRKTQHISFLEQVARGFPTGLHIPTNLLKLLEGMPGLHVEKGNLDRVHFDCGVTCDNEFCGNGKQWGEDFLALKIDMDCDIPQTKGYRQDYDEWHRNDSAVYLTGEILRLIYSSHLSRFEIGRFLNYLKVEPKNVVPLYTAPWTAESEMVPMLEYAVVCGKNEPEEFQRELPSYVYDFTTPTPQIQYPVCQCSTKTRVVGIFKH